MSVYSHGHSPSVLASHGVRTAADSAAYLLPELRSGLSLLDLGCGPGSITLDLAELVAPGRVVGVDSSGTVVTAAAEAARDRGTGNVTFRTADIHDLPFEAATFDVVHAHQVLQHLPDPVSALRTMGRMCAPEGLIAVRDADYRSMAWFPEIPGLDRWLEIYRAMARANGGEPDAGRRLGSWARAAGLTDVRVTVSAWHYTTAERVRWWGESWSQRTLASSYGPRAVDLGLATWQELREIAAAWREWSRDPDAWFAMLHSEVLARPAP